MTDAKILSSIRGGGVGRLAGQAAEVLAKSDQASLGDGLTTLSSIWISPSLVYFYTDLIRRS